MTTTPQLINVFHMTWRKGNGFSMAAYPRQGYEKKSNILNRNKITEQELFQ